MVKEGLGFSFIKASDLPLNMDGLTYAQIKDLTLYEETGIAYRKDNRSKRLTDFVLFLKNHQSDLIRCCLPQSDNGFNLLSDPRQLRLF